jgi:UDP-N-acetylmuramate--alanine ligase
VTAVLASARAYARGGRVLCVFHPHTYTRTRTFLAEFAEAFTAADHVMLPDIFAARETDPGDISSEKLAAAINSAGGSAAYFSGGFPDIADWIRANAKPGDLVLTMGAGLSSQVEDILLADQS